MIQKYYIGFEGVLQGLYRIVTGGLQRLDMGTFWGTPWELQGCYKCVKGVLHGYYRGVTGMLQVYLWKVILLLNQCHKCDKGFFSSSVLV